jgi:hypothetical protein
MSATISHGIDVTWVIDRRVTMLAGATAFLALFITVREIRAHISRYDYPRIQVYVLRVLLMIPIYATLSWFSLLVPTMRFFFDTIRDTYESFVLYMFFSLLIAYCGGEGQLLKALHSKRYMGVHPAPLCYLPLYPLDTDFYLRCKRWVLQYALIKPLSSFIAMITHPLGIYDETNFNLNNVYTYTCLFTNLSVCWSLYYLVLFELETEKELRYCKAGLKFVCIKSIIFFSFWQSVAISLLISWNFIYTGSDPSTSELVSLTLQDLLMCFELLPVALMHHCAFGRDKLDDEMSAEPVFTNDGGKKNTSSAKNLDEALSLQDVFQDTFATIFFRRGKLVDRENEDDEEAEEQAGGTVLGRGGMDGAARLVQLELAGHARDPTLDELVQYAILTDVGPRADGVLHLGNDSEDSDSDEENITYNDTDVITRRSRKTQDREVTAVVVDRQSGQVSSGPTAFCTVCGRFDREMVKRRSGYKCKECIGLKSNPLLRSRQKEAHAEDNDNSCIMCGRSNRPMVRREQKLVCIACLKNYETRAQRKP